MAIYGPSEQTVQITTGNVRTTYDPYDTTKPYNNQKNPLGATYFDASGATGGAAVSQPWGQPTLYKYVLYKSTTNGALNAAPAIVYYTDNTFSTVSGTLADGVTATTADVAGILMPNTTDISGFTATILNNGGNGSYVWIAIGGYVKAVNAPASTAVGDCLIGAAGNFTLARVALHTASTDRTVATALTAVASNKSDMLVQLVPIT